MVKRSALRNPGGLSPVAEGMEVRPTRSAILLLLVPATGYASQNEPIVHFGLGNAERVAALEVGWPSGVVDRVEAVGVDQVVEVVEGEGRR